MKNLFKLFGMALLLSSVVLFTACGDDDDNNDVDKPTNLKVAQNEGMNVTFSWSGNAESYVLKVEGREDIPVSGTSHTLEMGEGNYTWQLRAKKGDKYSDWVSGGSFEVSASLLYDAKIERPANNIAVFNWKGYADSYDIKIKITRSGSNVDEKTIENITAKTYRFENPQYTGISYKYNWEIRAKKGSEYSEWIVDTTAFYMYEAMPSDTRVTVEFKGRTWTATNVIGSLITISAYGESRDAIDIVAEEITDGFETVDFRYPLAEIGTVVPIDTTFHGAQVGSNYFEKSAHTVQGIFMGDWIFLLTGENLGEYKITSFSESTLKVSGELSVKLYNYDDYYGAQNPENPRTEVVKVKFENIKLEDKR